MQIVWFRRDLRIADNPALAAACARGPVLPVFVDAPEEEGDWAPGAASRWWLHHSLARLDAALRERGTRLCIRSGPTRAALLALARETGAAGICWNRVYEPALVARDTALKTALREAGLETRSFSAALLAEPWTLATGSGGPYRVFTPYWKKSRASLTPGELTDAPQSWQAPARAPRSKKLAELALLPQIRWDSGLAAHWTPGEAGAMSRLHDFCDGALAAYGSGRDLPAEDGVSGLSPHLHFGEISPRQVLAVLQARGSAADAAGREAWVRQLGWRDFAHHVLYHFPDTPDQPLRTEFGEFPWRRDYGQFLDAWQRGRTGIPLVDAGMRELWATGWMHNRVRMVVASLLVKNLRIPWQEGARWFWDTLVDADLANNTLGWQWAAGCGADAAPYFRVFNPVRQGERFDSQGRYVRRWIPELAAIEDKWIQRPWTMPEAAAAAAGFVIGRDYPVPVVDLDESRNAALAAWRELRSRSATSPSE